MGTFSEFLDAQGLKDEEILRRSRRLETLRSEDRMLRRRRAAQRRTGKQSYEEAGIGKPRSGRPLQKEHLEAARNDNPVPRPVRTKIVRAVNSLLEKKGTTVGAPELFGKVPGKQGKKPR